MKSLEEFVNEAKGKAINMQWLDNENPVMTKDGRQAIVVDIDLSKIPNIVKGQVKQPNDKLVNYEWTETGECTKATDMYGNPKKPEDSDTLVCAS